MKIRKEKKKFKKLRNISSEVHTIKIPKPKKKTLMVIFKPNQQFSSKVRYEISIYNQWGKNTRLSLLGNVQAAINAEKLRKELSRLKVVYF
jgi:hypothetical protein